MADLKTTPVAGVELTQRQIDVLARLQIRGTAGTEDNGSVLRKLAKMGLVEAHAGQYTSARFLVWQVARTVEAKRVATEAKKLYLKLG